MADAPSATVDPHPAYTARREARGAAHAVREQRHRTFGNLRLAGLGIAGALALGIIGGAAIAGWWLLAPLGVVFVLGVAQDRVEVERDRLARAVDFYTRGLARLEGRWAGTGSTGEAFADDRTPHLYARDLDLFGDGSLFQLICRASTRMGEATLAGWLLSPAEPDTVAARQQAIRELASNVDLQEDLAVLGDDARAGVHAKALIAWGGQAPMLDSPAFLTTSRLLSVAGGMALVAGVAYALAAGRSLDLSDGVLSLLRWYIIVSVVAVAIVNARFKTMADRVFGGVRAAAPDIALFAGVLERLEAERFEAPHLVKLRATLDVDGEPPSRRVARLARLMEQIDSRRNLFGRGLGFFLLRDVHLAHAVEAWRLASGPALRRWLHAVGEMEALSSLAGYRFERPAAVFPEVVAGAPLLEAGAIAHPLLDANAAVSNDVRLDTSPQVLIVSGSNMSGKSTLLRTIGINAVLAQAGAPVCARRLRMSPLVVGASIRVNDSLQDGRSRFYAEITRLRSIMDRTDEATPVLFLLDEFLHGTNSHDRQVGANAIVCGLADRGAIGLVTTHDLALTEIAATLGARGANVHFADHLTNGRLQFDYRMRPGVVQKSNAIELMRSVGLDV